MTPKTLVRPRRDPTVIALAILSVLLLVGAVAISLAWPNRVITIDLVDLTPTTAAAAVSVRPACATVDPITYPCPAGADMVVVAR